MTASYLSRIDILTAPASWQVVTDSNAVGGSYLSTTSGDAILEIDVPVGTTSILLLATARSDNGVCTYAIDGGPAIVWDQSNGATSSDPFYYWYRTTSPPINVNPHVAHTILLSAAPGGAVTTLDAVEFWQAQPFTPNAITWFGHSIVYGYLGGQCADASPATPLPMRFPTLVSTQNMYVAGVPTTMAEINQSVPGEDLTTGASGYGANAYAPLPGWQRAEAGADFAGTTWGNGTNCPAYPSPYLTAGAAPGPTWWATLPQIAVIMHTRNDVGMDSLYDGASATRVRPNPNRLAGENPRTMPPPAGSGYALKRYTQRLRELVWRMKCASPDTLIVLCGICYETVLAMYYANERANYDRATAMVAQEPTTGNTIFVDTWTPTANQDPAMFLQPDGGHPSAAGHHVLANIIQSAIAAPALVSGISDHGGLTTGHNSVTITGSRFFPGATVKFGNVAATSVTLVNNTLLQVQAPNHDSTTTPIDITVTNPYQMPGTPSGTLPKAYTYINPTPISRTPPPSVPTAPPGAVVLPPPPRPGVTPTPGAPTPGALPPAPLPPRR